MYIYNIFAVFYSFAFPKNADSIFLWFSSAVCSSKLFNTTGITNKGASPNAVPSYILGSGLLIQRLDGVAIHREGTFH